LFAALSDYMDGVIDDAVCEQMDLHLNDCQPCQAFLSSLKMPWSSAVRTPPSAIQNAPNSCAETCCLNTSGRSLPWGERATPSAISVPSLALVAPSKIIYHKDTEGTEVLVSIKFSP
jgi:hypothetical protein